jgi:hypothetical protein
MSLKGFHLVFVTLLTTLSLSCAAWAFDAGHPVLGGLGIATAILVIVYGIYFLRKLKNMSFL